MTDEQFKNVKMKAIHIWSSYDDTYDYAMGKVKRIINLDNSPESIITIFGMFDGDNQSRLINLLNPNVANMVIRMYQTGR